MPGGVTVSIDGKEISAEAGSLLIRVAQEHGIYVPRFCWHERMRPVGMCRMCLVEIEGQKGLPPACTATVVDGMVVRTQTEAVRKAQEGVLEFLLLNHPLDCPVCDRGGECPLQDLTFGFGPGESRYVEEKRHFAKPIPVSELVLLDRERCILCARCTRFADEVAGEPLISFGERGGDMEVITFPEAPFSSYFSGNTVQICPVGALLATPYRFRARPWDLTSAESSCQLCAVGCRVALQSSQNRLVRVLGVDSEAVNHGWLCDKGRFGFEHVADPRRFVAPTLGRIDGIDRKNGIDRENGVVRGKQRAEVSWPEALAAAAAGLTEALRQGGPESIALLGGARGTVEDAYAWCRLAKGVLRTDSVDCQLGDGLPAEVVLGLPRASLADCDQAGAIVLLAPDLREELPIVYLRLRRAVLELGRPLVEISVSPSGFEGPSASPMNTVRLRHRPGAAASTVLRLLSAVSGATTDDPEVARAAEVLRGAPSAVVVLGRPSLAESSDDTVHAAAALSAALPQARFLVALRRGNVHGALDMGLAPGMLPGRVGLSGARDSFERVWGGVPERPGVDAEGILRAAASGSLRALILLGADPLADFPDARLARRALEATPFVVAVDALPNGSNGFADVILPVAIFGEKEGTTTNLEGRLLRLSRKVAPPGTAMEDWMVAAELGARLGDTWDPGSAEEVLDEVARVAPSHLGIGSALVRSAPDGVLLPLRRQRGLRDGLCALEAEATKAAPSPTFPAHSSPGAASPGAASPGAASPGGEKGAGRVGDEEGGLLLWSGRRLYDDGIAVAAAPALRHLVAPAVASLHPSDLGRNGLPEGALARLSSEAGSVTVRVAGDSALPPGTVRLAFAHPRAAVSSLVEAGTSSTRVRLEPLVEMSFEIPSPEAPGG